MDILNFILSHYYYRCELRDPTNGCVSDIAWNPVQGLHLVTASGEDKNPIIKLWDLRSSTSLPLATLSGHTEGILSLSWCPNDESLLLSSGKDNKTILWDLFSLQPAYELPSTSKSDSMEQSMFGGLATSAGQKRYHVSWSPCLPSVISACSFDRKVQFFSLAGAKCRSGRAPKWLKRPVGASFGFGGKLISFDNSSLLSHNNMGNGPVVTVRSIQEDPQVGAACDAFHRSLAEGDFRGFCRNKANDHTLSDHDRQVWSLMGVICFEKNAREELLRHLGFDSRDIGESAANYCSSVKAGAAGTTTTAPFSPGPPPPPPVSFLVSSPSSARSAEQLFDSPANNLDAVTPPPAVVVPPPPLITIPPPVSPEVTKLAQEMAEVVLAGMEAESTIRKALVVGNFAAAVDCCLEAGLMAEALLLAQCGEPALFLKTQAVFFERHKQRQPFLQLLSAITKGEYMDLVLNAPLNRWQETLALLSTYGKSEEFATLCEALAGRLENEAHDIASATLCYMCAGNVGKSVGFWVAELKAANAAVGRMNNTALQQFIEKVELFTKSNPVDNLGPECSYYFAQYASLLASQGRLDVATQYLKGDDLWEKILRDRIYHSMAVPPPGTRPPPFPFERVNINPPVVVTPVAVTSSPSAAHRGQMTSSGKANPTSGNTVATTQSTLPPGWQQLVDPASGRPYYVNQGTGQSQWDPPALVVQPTVSQVPQSVVPSATTISHTQSPGAAIYGKTASATPTGLGNQSAYAGASGATAAGSSGFIPQRAGMVPSVLPVPQGAAAAVAQSTVYGGTSQSIGAVASPQSIGYVSQQSAGHPGSQTTFASQYVTQPQASPAPSVQPQSQLPVATPAPAPAPVAKPAPLPLFPAAIALEQMIANLNSKSIYIFSLSLVAIIIKLSPCYIHNYFFLLEKLGYTTLSAADKRQLQMVSQCHNVLKEMATGGEIGLEVQEKLDQLVAALATRNFQAANAVQTVVNSILNNENMLLSYHFIIFSKTGFSSFVLDST